MRNSQDPSCLLFTLSTSIIKTLFRILKMFEMNNMLCRLCLSSDSSQNSFYCIYREKDSEESPLAMKIYFALEIKVSNAAGLHNSVCKECVQKLEFIIAFKSWISKVQKECSEVHSMLESYQDCGSDKAENQITSVSRVKSKSEELTLKWLINTLNSSMGPLLDQQESCTSKDTVDSAHEITEKEQTSLEKVQETLILSCALPKGYHSNSNIQPQNGHSPHIDEVITKEEQRSKTSQDSDSYYLIKNMSGNVNHSCSGLRDDVNEISSEGDTRTSRTPILAFNSHSNVKQLHCPECSYSFDKRNLLLKHLRSHEGAESKYQCSICKRVCVSVLDLDRHVRAHNGLKPYHCNKCNKYFSQKNLLDKHVKWHVGEKSHLCDICGLAVSSQSNLSMHILHLHSLERKNVFECKECNKIFARKHHLENHYAVHEESRPHQCATCGKTYKRVSQLKEHEILHTGEKNYKCSECDKSFSKKRVLNVHKLLHKELKAHKCPKCQKSFIQSNRLMAHLKTHSK